VVEVPPPKLVVAPRPMVPTKTEPAGSVDAKV
jgi:hypothetical protein